MHDEQYHAAEFLSQLSHIFTNGCSCASSIDFSSAAAPPFTEEVGDACGIGTRT